MSIKVLNCYSSLLLVLLVKVLNAEGKDDIKIKFLLNNGACTQDQDGRTHWLTELESSLSISVSGKYHINYYNCTAGGKEINVTGDPINNEYIPPNDPNAKLIEITIPKITLKNHMEGLWICYFLTNRDTNLPNSVIVQHKGLNHTQNECHFNVTFKDSKSNATIPASSEIDTTSWIYITSGSLLLFTIIILVQTCIIIYCKVKAQRVTRIQSLSLSVRSSSNQEDKKRYSTTPSRRNRISELFGKANQKEETCIYETLDEVHAGYPPTPPIETIPTLKRKPSELDVRNRKRPPVPLPKEVSDDDVTNSVRDIQRHALKQSLPFTEEPKAKPPTTLLPLPESPTKPEPEIKPKPLKHKPEIKGKPTRSRPLIPETDPERPTTPGLARPLKSKPGPSIVASELDDIFKRRHYASQPVPSGSSQNSFLNSSQNKLDQTFGKSEVESSVVRQRPQTQTLNRSSPKPVGKVEPLNSGTLKKKQLPPPVPAPNPISQPPVPPIPVEPPSQATPGAVPRPLPDVQESLYEEYDEEEPVYYNSDEEWTYEPLRPAIQYLGN